MCRERNTDMKTEREKLIKIKMSSVGRVVLIHLLPTQTTGVRVPLGTHIPRNHGANG